MDVLNQSPVMQFRDLDEIVTHKICINIVPVSVFSANQVKVTDYTVSRSDYVRVKDNDVTWSTGSMGRRKTLNLYGRITSQKGRIEDIFEEDDESELRSSGEDFTYLYIASRAKRELSNQCRVKDVAEDRKGTWSGTIIVP